LAALPKEHLTEWLNLRTHNFLCGDQFFQL